MIKETAGKQPITEADQTNESKVMVDLKKLVTFINRIVVGLSSWMRSLACGKEEDGCIFCKVDSVWCKL